MASSAVLRHPSSRLDGLDPVLDFLQLLWRVEHELQAASKRMHQRMGITGPQRLVLRIVEEYPGVGPGEVARLLHLHPSTVTGIIQRLIAKRLLKRERSVRDTRRFHLRTRGSARRYTRTAEATVERAVARVLRATPGARVRGAREMLAAIADALGRSDS